MVVFTIAAVALAVVTIGAASISGVLDLARREDLSRLQAYRQLLADDITGHLMLARRIVDSLGSLESLRPDPKEPLPRALARVAVDNAEYVDALVLADGDGRVVAVSRSGVVGASVASAPAFRLGASRTGSHFEWRQGLAPGKGELWIAKRLEGPAGTGMILLARVRTGFITRLLDEIALGTVSRTALVVSEAGATVDVGLTSVVTTASAVTFAAPTGGQTFGTATMAHASYGRMTGFYQDVTAVPELGWRVVVLESDSEAMQRARDALVPAGVATGVAAILAFLSAAVFARRLTAPLTALERHARDIASGGYVRPLPVERTDEVGRLADAFNDMGVRLNSLQDVAQLLASAGDSREVLDAVLSAISHILGTGDAAVLIAETDAGELVLARGRGLRSPDMRFSVPFSEASPLAAAYRDRRAVPFEGQSARWAHSVFRLFDAPPDRSGVVVPLSVGEDVLGVVVALAAGKRPVTQAQIETLRAFSAQAAVAVRTSRLFEHEHASRREAEALREVAELIAGTHDLGAALDRVAAVAAGLLDMSDCAVAIDDRSSFGLQASDDPREEAALLALWRELHETLAPDGSPFEPVVVDANTTHGDVLAGTTLLLVPLVRADSVRGVLALSVPEGADPPGARQVALAGTLGREVSLALDNAALLQEARTRAANLETVFRISQAVSSSLQIGVVLNRVLDVVQKIFSAEAVSLMAYDVAKRTIDTSMARGLANREMLYFQAAPGQDLSGDVFATRNPMVCGDLAQVDTPLARMAVEQGLHSLLAVPLLARGRSIGVLTVYDRAIDAFSEADKELLLTFASQAALAIDTASLYSKEHHVASVLQASILPERLPDLPGLESASFYLPAGVEAEIGGDYYDLFLAREGVAVLAIGDVCGKGVQAATKTSMIKYSLRGMVAAGATPAAALAELNRLVAYSGDPSDIVTAWVGFLDAGRTTLTYADAGHPPGLVLRRDGGRFERLGPTGPLLGAIEDATYEEQVVSLSPGDLLLTYTDGVTEARRRGEFFGEGRVRAAIRSSGTAANAVASLLDSVSDFSAGAMHDDAAVLAVRVLGDQPVDLGDEER